MNPVSVTDAHRVVAEFQRKFAELQGGQSDLKAKVEQVLPLAPDEIRKKAEELWQKYLKDYDPWYHLIERYAKSSAWPPTLLKTGERWHAEVYTEMTTTQHIISRAHLSVENYWEGTAAKHYKKTVHKQHDACKQAALLSDNISTALNNVGSATLDFLIAVIGGIVGFLAAVLTAIITAETIIIAVLALIGAVLSLGETVIQGSWTYWQATNTITQNIRTLHEETANEATFSTKHWPKATSTGTWRAD